MGTDNLPTPQDKAKDLSFAPTVRADRLNISMRILLSNDDGVFAPGLAALRQVLDDLGEVAVVAPDTPQSAAGHSITLSQALNVRQVTLDTPQGYSATSVDGRPADCVRLAIRTLLEHRPELVLSGINAGANVGVNVFYSGTVAAAAEAAMLGIPAVAFSVASPAKGPGDFGQAAMFCRWVLEQLLTEGLTAGDLINVNIPEVSSTAPRGIRVVPQSTTGIEDVYHPEINSTGGKSYRLGEEYTFLPDQASTDVPLLAEGYITVTPLHVDMTNHDRLAVLAHRKWPELPKGYVPG